MTPMDCQQALSVLFQVTLQFSYSLSYLIGMISMTRTQGQLNTEFDPLPSFVNRKSCAGEGGVCKNQFCLCSLSLTHPPHHHSLSTWNTPSSYPSELVRILLTVFLCKRHWALLMNTENAKQRGPLNI